MQRVTTFPSTSVASRERIRLGGHPAPPVAEGRRSLRFVLHPPANDNKAPLGKLMRRYMYPLLFLLATAGLIALLRR